VLAFEDQVDVWVRYLDGSGPTPYLAALAVGVSMAGLVASFMHRALKAITRG
jgi:hypothetical protein